MPTTEAKVVRVSAAVILRCLEHQNHILIAKRLDHLHKGGYWEFPGGKIDTDETAAEALVRELNEEIGIQVNAESCHFLFPISWEYPEKKIELNTFLVREFDGEPTGREGQEVRWVSSSDIDQYLFPEANESIVNWVSKNLDKS